MDYEAIKAWTMDQVNNNQFFTGAIGGSIAYALLSQLKSHSYTVYSYVKRLFIRELTLHINTKDNMCKEYHKYCMSFIKRPRNIKIIDRKENSPSPKYIVSYNKNMAFLNTRKDKQTPEIIINYGLSYGTHWFMYNWYTLACTNITEDSNNHTECKTELITTSFFSLRPDHVRKLFNQNFVDLYEKNISEKPGVYTINDYGDLIKNKDLPKRTLDSIFINDNIKTSLVDNIEKLCQESERLQDLGISTVLGVLLYGDPGTGKSSLIVALANYFHMDVYYLNFGEKDNVKTKLQHISAIRENSLLVIEDIDCYEFAQSRDLDSETKKGARDLAEILKMLDGNGLPNNTIVVATTNYIDKLDSAVKRFGRFDLKLELKRADRGLAEAMIKRIDETKMYLLDEVQYPIAQAELQAKILGRIK